MRLVLLLGLAFARLAVAQGGPDLTLDLGTLRTSFDLQSFAPTDCELQAADACVDAAGVRKLLRFGVFAVNQGDDLVLGVPRDDDPMWVFSACHKHYHFESFARYELRDVAGGVFRGQKRSFCVEDTAPAGATTPQKYCCNARCNNVQGVQHGWGDLYPSNLPCQWIDVTDIAPGDYQLCVALNFEQRLPETDYTNNSGCVPVHIDGPNASPPPRVRVRAPTRGARARMGRQLRIRWQARVRGRLKAQELWYSRDGGRTYGFITDDIPETARSFRWAVPTDSASDDARIKVVVCARNPENDPGAGALKCGEALSRQFRITS